MLAGVTVQGEASHRKQAEIFFDVPKLSKGVEFRLETDGEFDGEILEFALTRISQGERAWRFDDPALKLNGVARSKTGIAVRPGAFGRVIYGPNVACAAGAYDLSIEFSLDTQFSRLGLEVCADSGRNVLQSLQVSSASLGLQNVLVLGFELDSAFDDVEFRFEVFGDFVGEVRSLTLRPRLRGAEGGSLPPPSGRRLHLVASEPQSQAQRKMSLRGLLKAWAG